MQLQLLKGTFSKADAIALISQFVEAKIKFHEQKIENDSSEEQIKMRESRIKELQQQWKALRDAIAASNGMVEAESIIEVDIRD
jgi:restriction endonuclease